MGDENQGLGYDGGQGDSGGGAHPAWQEFYGDAAPEIVEKYIEPAFRKWDTSVNQRFDKVHQQYDPWNDVIKNTDPESATFALNLINALNTNPKEIIPKLAEHYQLDNLIGGTVAQGQAEPKVEDDPYSQKFNEYQQNIAELQKRTEIMAQALLQKHQAEEDAKADAWVDNELARLRQVNQGRGEFNDEFVCALSAQAGISLEEAANKYYENRDAELRRHGTKPLIMHPGGGVPGGNTPSFKNMKDKDVNSFIANMLDANRAAQQQ